VVTLAFAHRGELGGRAVVPYIAAQVIGAILGVWLAHLMFGLPILQASSHARGTAGEWAGEFVATFGLLCLILSASRHAPHAVPYGVAAYITGAYWFTSSTSFANPAVTIARALTDSFAGIDPRHVPGFVIAELAGAAAAAGAMRWLLADGSDRPVNTDSR
jgi:glycerol uptake facilitator-like aquaporin